MRRRVAEVMVILGLCVMAVTAMAAAQDPPPVPVEPVPTAEPTPEPTPVPTPSPAPEPTPEPTPEPAPEPPAAQAQQAPAAAPELAAAPRQAAPEETVTLCHATGAASAPYVTITLPKGALLGHDAHPADLVPAPAGGCPAAAQAPAPAPTPEPVATPEPRDEATICHAAGDGFVEIVVSRRGLPEHRRHEGDLIPAPAGGCPAAAPRPAAEPEPHREPEPAAPRATPEPPRGEVLDDSQTGAAPVPAPATAPVPTLAPAVAAAPVARAQGTRLAYTGAEALLLGLLGFGMALAGAGLFLVTAEPRPR